MDQLRNQREIAPKHIATTWPIVREQVLALPAFRDIRRIVICGCGDSHHASIGLSMGFSKLTSSTCYAVHSMHAARYLLPQYTDGAEKTLVVAISASGEVARTIEALEMANSMGMETVAFTGNPIGTLAQTSKNSIVFSGPELPHGPGLISYLTSLLMGYALMESMRESHAGERLDQALHKLIDVMEDWVRDRWDAGEQFAGESGDGICVFLGSGPAFGSALFGAAKLLEASGELAWGQDVEEWAHLEYFGTEADARTWLLSASGRSYSRELEIKAAAEAIGRQWHQDRWDRLKPEFGELNEILAPLVLWAGPSGYASRRTVIRQEIPFRNFGGGRDREEGGGASRIRSSERLLKFD
ncbi:MAG: SIS domain-containing protein [Anaerolineales bacterium]|jgi:glucosamine--fructose-6-phosphate aminotransferase (isomerizing)